MLTGSPITDMKITLIAGRAHPKHTEGGDFRQATYRAVRQGLRSAQSILLEPVCRFRLELPPEQLGRALNDLQRMEADFAPPETAAGTAVLTGTAALAALREYPAEVIRYTHGRGRLLCEPAGYAPCRHAQEVIEASGYDCDADTENPADSIFCSHGAGHPVRWDSGLACLSMPSKPETVICRREGVVGLKVLIDILYTPFSYTIPSKNSMVLESWVSWT